MTSLAESFMALFAGLERAHGRYEMKPPTAGGKQGGKAHTFLQPVTLDLWQKHLEGKTGLGVIPIRDDATCVFGAVDIDVYEGMDLPKLEEEVIALGLPLVVCRTKSGGAHLYLFCSEPIPANIVRAKMTSFASALGHMGVEIFPKQNELASEKDVGNWINMPYFGADRTTRYAIRGGSALDTLQFLQYAREKSVTQEDLVTVSPVVNDDFQDGPPCLQVLSRYGFPEGHRNDSLYSLGVYCRAKYGDTWEEVIDQYNRQYMIPPLSSKEVQFLIKGLSKKEGYFYKCKQPPLCNHCNKELCRQREFGIASNDDSPGVMFDTLVKIEPVDKDSMDPPTWIVGIEGRRLVIDTDELLDQNRFNRKCVEKLNKMLRAVKPAAWRQVIQDLLNNVEIIEAPMDSGPEGRFWLMLEQFCTGRAQARVKDELLLGKPWTDAERTYFRLPDLMRELDRQRFNAFKEREIWAIIRRRKGEHHQFNLKGKCCQCWSVPEFPRQSEDFDLPTIGSEEKF